MSWQKVLSSLHIRDSTDIENIDSLSLDLAELASAWDGCDGTESSSAIGFVDEPQMACLESADEKLLTPFVKRYHADSISFPVIIRCFGQYRAWGDVFGSLFRQRTVKSSNVLVNWQVSGTNCEVH